MSGRRIQWCDYCGIGYSFGSSKTSVYSRKLRVQFGL